MENRVVIRNPFKGAERGNDEQRLHENLSREFTPLPYHHRNRLPYTFSLIASWFASVLSAVTEYSIVFAFLFGMIGKIQFGNEISIALTVLFLTGFELAHRHFTSAYFKEFWQDGGAHQSDNNANLAVMLVFAVASLALSLPGGFDLMRLVKQKPEKTEVTETQAQDVAGILSPIVTDAKSRIKEYKTSAEWRGRLADKDRREYRRLTRMAEAREDSLITAVLSVPEQNEKRKREAEEAYRAELERWQGETKGDGTVLAFLSVITSLLMYFCLWYCYKYKKKTHEYLVSRFSTPAMPAHPSPAPSPVNGNASAAYDPNMIASVVMATLQQMQPQQQGKENVPSPTPLSNHYQEQPKKPLPIGYYNDAQLAALLGESWRVETPVQTCTEPQHQSGIMPGSSTFSVQVCTEEETHTDLYTILHRYEKGSKIHFTPYTENQILARIAQYEREANEAQSKQLGQEVIENRLVWLAYWREMLAKLIAKQIKAGIRKESSVF